MSRCTAVLTPAPSHCFPCYSSLLYTAVMSRQRCHILLTAITPFSCPLSLTDLDARREGEGFKCSHGSTKLGTASSQLGGLARWLRAPSRQSAMENADSKGQPLLPDTQCPGEAAQALTTARELAPSPRLPTTALHRNRPTGHCRVWLHRELRDRKTAGLENRVTASGQAMD